MAKAMNKVMRPASKKKRIYSENGILPSANDFSKGSTEGRYSGSARRVSVLNKLFMKYITDILATGEYSNEFTGLGIEVNRVQVTPDYNGLNVFWVAKGTPDDEKIESVLKKNAGYLRHELSSLRVMGAVPKIYFVKDKHLSQIMEVEVRLAVADFGEDHVPIELATKLKAQLELFTEVPTEVKKKLEQLDEKSPLTEELEEELPPMPQNVLGLDHSQILLRIQKTMKKTEAAHRVKEDITLAQAINTNPIEFSSNKERREVFRQFLEKRELERSRAKKMDKNYYPDAEYLKQEFEERQAEYFANLDMYCENDKFTDVVEDDTATMT